MFYISTYRKKGKAKAQKNVGLKSDQVVTATGRAAETLKSARSRFGQASMESVESSAKGQWVVSRD
jgi:fatty acid elongase 3